MRALFADEFRTRPTRSNFRTGEVTVATLVPTWLREIMSELLDRSTAMVKRYGGTLSQFTGDGIMAVFGAPVALEDHAVRPSRSPSALRPGSGRVMAPSASRLLPN